MRRLVWFGLGFGSSIWVRRAARRKAQQYVPPDVRAAVGERARATSRTVRAAVSEGRRAMREYQEDAAAEVDPDRRRRSLRAVSNG